MSINAAASVSDVVICSFYTADAYYRGHANALRANLERLGITAELEEIEKLPGQDWADICRKKVPFFARVAEKHPDKKVFWIDVDCALLSLPDYVANFTADLIGFQRGFSSPMTIGYANRSRFWEPCFFGVNTTPTARSWIAEAARIEAESDIKATDDYFFEEAWRTHAPTLSFQIIPSVAVLSHASEQTTDVVPFFNFGSSGSVAEFKGKVVQHDAPSGAFAWLRPNRKAVAKVRRKALGYAKRVEAALPEGPRNRARKIADQSGVTHLLTGGKGGFLATRAGDAMIKAGQQGELDKVDKLYATLCEVHTPTFAQDNAYNAARAFGHYAGRESEFDPITMVWWAKPLPGNFGDWLSPLVVGSHTDRSIVFSPPTAPLSSPHIVAVGSIGRFIKPSSIVLGTGVSNLEVELEKSARYVSVRGPLTAQLLKDCGGPTVESFGDPGALMRRVMPVERGTTNGRTAFVRHFTHRLVPMTLPDDMDEFTVLRSQPQDIQDLVTTLAQYDQVLTSAMHVMIVCHSYGIPVALVSFEGLEAAVHGTGIKYRDYCEGVGLSKVYEPQVIGHDLTTKKWEQFVGEEFVSDAKLDEIETAVNHALAAYTELVG